VVFFEAIAKGIIILISFSASSLLVYKKANFCMLILYSTLPRVSYLRVFWWSHMYRISSANRDNLMSSFAICVPYISFSCLIALAKNSSIILSKNGESEYPCLVLDLEKRVSILTYLYHVDYRFVIYILYYMNRRYVPFIPSLFRAFIMEGC
jgi:hypothetical protein